ncbi:DUF1802 family protein [Paenibacillus aestuarii]|uniref:DUF1802 family protein n=1 Tax=Paenibacillus aestuarii TaxID=516965 RepID=A0ABW0KHC8_9BACL|nr:DUF1802 family protein [Paenibacillus aestuarii]
MLPIALKEWASAIKALEDGSQIFIMRKGGIVEETRDFQVQADAFFLYPTYEHQRKGLLKEEFRGVIDDTLAGWSPDDKEVKIGVYAQMVEDILVSDQEQLDKIFPFHIWTENFTEERLKWKRSNPLHIMLLRVHKLEQPLHIPIEQAYLGCRSWIQVQASLPSDIAMTPVLSDSQFAAQADEIKRRLASN